MQKTARTFFQAGMILAAVLMSGGILVSCAEKDPDTRLAVEDGIPVADRYGALQVIGTDLCDSAGNPVQLRGMSSHGLQWYGRYANENVLRWLRDDWNVQVWRAAMYLTQGGYISGKALKFKVIESIEAAEKLGMYVIVDWHVLGDRDPRLYQDEAVAFFSEIAEKYGHLPHVIYEICNEPNGEDVTWSGAIKPYAETVIAAIRAHDPDNIIIVGTPTWSRDVDQAALDPLSGSNLMYTLHFYAGSHGRELQEKAVEALEAGLPLFVTEWGTTRETGDGGVFEKESVQWLSFLKKHNISWVNWSVNNKGEDSGVLKAFADKAAQGGWTEEDLSPSGIFMRSVLRLERKIR